MYENEKSHEACNTTKRFACCVANVCLLRAAGTFKGTASMFKNVRFDLPTGGNSP